ncbi:MAG: NAD(P)/FAD-dependent oxidoreductase, partial [Planctomycetota bacterium]
MVRSWRLFNVRQEIDEPDSVLRERAAKLAGLDPKELHGFRIARRSVDARRRPPRFVCHVDLVLDRKTPAMARLEKKGRLRPAPVPGQLEVAGAPKKNVVVVGSGPAGLFAALVLGRSGSRVTLIDRGARLEERGPRLVKFHRTRVPDPETNLLFGEGGAGTYSDGKLYTRVDHELEVPILEELVACGAPPDILYDARSHIGTDRLHRLLPRLRAKLEEAGVEFLWETRLEEINEREVLTSRGPIGCDAIVLAVGHSARDTWKRLHEQGVRFEAKPFQFGVRVEHPQELITRERYGTDAL